MGGEKERKKEGREKRKNEGEHWFGYNNFISNGGYICLKKSTMAKILILGKMDYFSLTGSGPAMASKNPLYIRLEFLS